MSKDSSSSKNESSLLMSEGASSLTSAEILFVSVSSMVVATTIEETETNNISAEVSEEAPSDINKDDSFFDDDESFDIDESLFEEKNTGVSVSKVQFESPSSSVNESQIYDKNLFKNIKVDVSIELGRSKVSLL